MSTALTAKQERAVVMIADLELRGEAITRYLKTPYSCPGCGYVAGDGGQPRDERKRLLDDHMRTCDRHRSDISHPFICAFSTYYSRWTKDAAFTQALAATKRQARSEAINQAVEMLQAASPNAVKELARQVADLAIEPHNRRLAAVAILDRADFSTASKHETKLPPEVVAIADAIYGPVESDNEEDGDDHLE